ncbi:MAG: hypothetical protein QM811_31190 [Pirellulales bacterium]
MAKLESHCRWIGNKSFVERSYTVTKVDGSKSGGVQIIGWNALTERVQSWNFSDDGGHAVGVWAPLENGWSAEIQGVSGDGVPTGAVNTLIKLDENAYAWKSQQRTLADKALPDSEEVVFKRTPAAR